MENHKSTQLSSQKRTLIFICLVVSGIASSTLATAMTTALPNVVEYFGISTSVGQWITSGYSLAMGVVMPLTAFLITRFPYRYRKLYLRTFDQYLCRKFRDHDGRKSPSGLRKRCLNVCGSGGDPHRLSY